MSGQKITQPSLFVSVAKDPLFPPTMAAIMDNCCTNLSKAHIEESGHWVQSEAPNQLNKILLDWLGRLNTQGLSKL